MENLQSKHDVVETGRESLIDIDHLAKKVAQMINIGDYFQQNQKIRNTPDSLEKAAETLKKAQEVFWAEMEKMNRRADVLENSTKKISGRVRDTQQKLIDSFKKIDSSLNLDRLERQVVMLERVADAMERLKALQESGKFEKIMEAIK
ncbi:hypothetical protein [Acinetobacter johnsonii]|uniref:hypothetical protein n=1 Tax=Acinetobacter johnsonii TaxID=40214 RepID=UPI003F5688A1